jgi:hypothetical protein
VAKILDNLPTTISELDISYNYEIGDAGMKHLHLIPDSVTHLDLSSCDLGPIGIKRVCLFLKTNKFITRFLMMRNQIGDEGFKDVADMLKVNNTISKLDITDCQILTAANCSHLSEGLAQNTGLRYFSIGTTDELTDQHIQNRCPGLAVNRGLENLDLMSSTHITEMGVGYLETVLQSNVYLKLVGDGLCPPFSGTAWDKLTYWIDLNKCNRKLIQDPNCTRIQWRDAIIKSSDAGNPDAIYMFLTNKPEWCIV